MGSFVLDASQFHHLPGEVQRESNAWLNHVAPDCYICEIALVAEGRTRLLTLPKDRLPTVPLVRVDGEPVTLVKRAVYTSDPMPSRLLAAVCNV